MERGPYLPLARFCLERGLSRSQDTPQRRGAAQKHRVGAGTVEKDQEGGNANRRWCCTVCQFPGPGTCQPLQSHADNAEQTEAVARERRGVGVLPCTSNGVQACKQRERERERE